MKTIGVELKVRLPGMVPIEARMVEFELVFPRKPVPPPPAPRTLAELEDGSAMSLLRTSGFLWSDLYYAYAANVFRPGDRAKVDVTVHTSVGDVQASVELPPLDEHGLDLPNDRTAWYRALSDQVHHQGRVGPHERLRELGLALPR